MSSRVGGGSCSRDGPVTATLCRTGLLPRVTLCTWASLARTTLGLSRSSPLSQLLSLGGTAALPR